MRGLKLNISLTLVLLLAAGMLLTNAIITAFWLFSVTRTLTEQKKGELSALTAVAGTDLKVYGRYFQAIHEHNPGSCGAVSLEGRWRTVPNAACEGAPQLRSVVDRALHDNKATTARSRRPLASLAPSRPRLLHIAIPISTPEGAPGAVGITYPLPSARQILGQHQKIILVYILVNTIVLAVIGFFRIAAVAIRPIDRLIEKASNYSGDQALGLVSENEGSEFHQLSLAINRMVQRIAEDKVNLRKSVTSLEEANQTIRRTQQDMVRAEKLASVGRLSAGLAHEIGNPLGIVLGYLGLLRQDGLPLAERLEYIERSEQELQRINALVRRLLDFSRPLPATSQPVRLHSLLLHLQQMLRDQKKNQDIAFTNTLTAGNDTVVANEDALRQAFLNFYLNALDALHDAGKPGQGTIMTESATIDQPEGPRLLRIRVSDNGAGIPAGQLKNIFDPFFTTKEPGKGTGLGLSVSLAIIEQYGGTVGAASTEGEGATIIIDLPLAPEPEGACS